MKPQKEWVCWVLSRKDIDSVANSIGLNAKVLTKRNYEDIVRKFNNEFRKENRHWQLILEDAIERKLDWQNVPLTLKNTWHGGDMNVI